MSTTSRTALVVGGSRGIGLAAARGFAASGHDVVVVGRRPESVRAAVKAAALDGLTLQGRVCDVASPTDLAAWLESGDGPSLDDVDIAVFAAGAASSARFVDTKPQDLLDQFTMNTAAPQTIAARVLPGMLERGWGRLVFIGSLSSLAGHRYTTAYAASKHALLGVMRALAAEVVGTGVTSNAVCPGYVDTDMTRELVASLGERSGSTPAEIRRRLERSTATGSFLTPDEVAAAVAFFAGETATGVNGQVLVVDGGGMQH